MASCEVRIIIKSTLEPLTLNDGKGEYIKDRLRIDVIFTVLEALKDVITIKAFTSISSRVKTNSYRLRNRFIAYCTNIEHRMHNQIVHPHNEV